MDGKILRNQLAFLLRESTTSSFLDEKTSYDFLYEAAIALAVATKTLHGIQTITTVDGTNAYNLNLDFLSLMLLNDQTERVIKYYDGSSYSFIPHRSYEATYISNNTDETSIPSTVSVIDNPTQPSNITGTTTATGSTSETEPLLTDSTASFTSTVSVGDAIHNTTDGSDGIVIEVSTGTTLKTNLFYGTNNYWTSGDAYVIVPQGRLQLVVDPTSSTSGHYIYVPYIQRPAPVYSEYRTYRFNSIYQPALVKYAAWLYKYRDQEPNYGDAWYTYWTKQVSASSSLANKGFDRSSFRVNLIKRGYSDRSSR